mgnify:CR=1 FL=1
MLSYDFVDTLPELEPLKPQELWNIIKQIGTGKAVGMDAWGPAELKALPWQAIVELTGILNQIERDGKWPEGLRGALVALLPKKMTHPRSRKDRLVCCSSSTGCGRHPGHTSSRSGSLIMGISRLGELEPEGVPTRQPGWEPWKRK